MPREDERKTDESVAVQLDSSGSSKAVLVKWAIVSAILLLFVGMQVGIAYVFVKKLKEPTEEDAGKMQEAAEREATLRAQTEMGATLAAPIEVTVNISGEDGRYLKCGVQLEYDPSFAQLGLELEARKVRIKDIIMDIMSSQPLSVLVTNDGRRAIREQIVVEVNSILPERGSDGRPLGRVRRSFFDSFIMQ
ncbi:MAG: flagellar basal body-associated FliL family protein [Fibromonadaceae bacterium]|jgi:flagellar basal body-associated protein FliL|nr:flagellar basal body-associated FliL family protein [Fibromonadaceae bacterium]